MATVSKITRSFTIYTCGPQKAFVPNSELAHPNVCYVIFQFCFYNFSLSDVWVINLGTVFILQLSVYKSSGSVLTISIRSSW